MQADANSEHTFIFSYFGVAERTFSGSIRALTTRTLLLSCKQARERPRAEQQTHEPVPDPFRLFRSRVRVTGQQTIGSNSLSSSGH